MAAPLQRTSPPGVYARGSRWVAVYLEHGKERRRSAPTFREAREIKIRATAQEAARAPRRRRGRPYEFDERRFLTRQQLARLLDEIPDDWRPLFDLLASTGLRISEAIALRVMDVALDSDQSRIHVRRAIVNGQLTGPKSRHGRRTIPISHALAKRLAVLIADRDESKLLFVGAQGATLRPGNLRYRVMIQAAERAGVPWARFHTLRHTCAALLIDAGASPLRLQRWMGHHSAAFTLDNHGHLIDDGLGPSVDLGVDAA